MSIYKVIRKADGATVYEYQSDATVEWYDYPFADFYHVEQEPPVVEPEPVDPAKWRIYVGAFFDRFGAAKIPVLASDNAIVHAMIKDASVRKYIGLYERRDELLQMIGMINTLVAGVSLNASAIVDTEPTVEELWHE